MTRFRRILVPYDFSTHATAALEAALALADGPRSRVILFHVVAPVLPITDVPPALMDDLDVKMLVSAARERLETLAQTLVRKRRGGPRIEVRVESGNPADEIVAAGRRADIIVVSTAGRTGLAHFLIGSVAERVVRHATVPVLTLRAKPVRARRRPARRRARRA